ncbi:hypothetical protein VNO77_24143 [Canavalia gladiata]|uniref:Uncharacterized protein n=1 Tax=Canavalia gladiata TaxID=3824 RepID=A0AAN9Q9L3_CANGL
MTDLSSDWFAVGGDSNSGSTRQKDLWSSHSGIVSKSMPSNDALRCETRFAEVRTMKQTGVYHSPNKFF